MHQLQVNDFNTWSLVLALKFELKINSLFVHFLHYNIVSVLTCTLINCSHYTHRQTNHHSMACSSDLKHFGRPLRNACIEGNDSIAVPMLQWLGINNYSNWCTPSTTSITATAISEGIWLAERRAIAPPILNSERTWCQMSTSQYCHGYLWPINTIGGNWSLYKVLITATTSLKYQEYLLRALLNNINMQLFPFTWSQAFK